LLTQECTFIKNQILDFNELEVELTIESVDQLASIIFTFSKHQLREMVEHIKNTMTCLYFWNSHVSFKIVDLTSDDQIEFEQITYDKPSFNFVYKKFAKNLKSQQDQNQIYYEHFITSEPTLTL